MTNVNANLNYPTFTSFEATSYSPLKKQWFYSCIRNYKKLLKVHILQINNITLMLYGHSKWKLNNHDLYITLFRTISFLSWFSCLRFTMLQVTIKMLWLLSFNKFVNTKNLIQQWTLNNFQILENLNWKCFSVLDISSCCNKFCIFRDIWTKYNAWVLE